MSTRRSVADALAWFGSLEGKLTPQQREIARAILKEINERLGFLHNVGLDYLHLDRTSGTLSRRREPAHPPRLADRLRPLGRALRPRRAVDRPPPEGQRPPPRNAQAPQAASATPCWSSSMTRTRSATPTMSSTWAPAPASTAARWSAPARSTSCSPARTSLTADYLSGRREIPLRAEAPQGHRQESSPSTAPAPTTSQDVTVEFPLGTFTCVTGVCGSGKSSLTIDTLYAAAARALNGARILCRPVRRHHRPRASRQGHRHRPVADRPHPALQPGDLHRRLHPDPRLVRRPARKRRRAATSPAASASTSRAAAARRARATAC